MPENLTTWKARVWTMAAGTRVGQGDAEVVTYKNLIVRLQAPRFFTQKDEVVLSANVHNYLKTSKDVKVLLDMPGGYLAPRSTGARRRRRSTQHVQHPGRRREARGLAREGRQPRHRHGPHVGPHRRGIGRDGDELPRLHPRDAQDRHRSPAPCGPATRPPRSRSTCPQERLINDSRVEVRYSPSVASAMVDALPYLVDYPYGCTEQTLNRFLPTVITQKVLLDMKLDLKDIEKKRTNLNAQEIGDDEQARRGLEAQQPAQPRHARAQPRLRRRRGRAA